MPSYVITGTSRGIGLEFVKSLSSNPSNTVFALARNLPNATQLLDFVANNKNVYTIEADNEDREAIKAAAQKVAQTTGGSLDVLILNAAFMMYERGALNFDQFPSEDVLEDDLLKFFKINVIGPIHTVNAFLPLLKAGQMKKCIAISSPIGNSKFCISVGVSQGTGYGVSKAALNLAMAKYAAQFKNEGIIFCSVTPGLVRTFPGTREEVEKRLAPNVARIRAVNPNFEGTISPEESAKDILAMTERVTIADTGRVLHRDGRDGDEML